MTGLPAKGQTNKCLAGNVRLLVRLGRRKGRKNGRKEEGKEEEKRGEKGGKGEEERGENGRIEITQNLLFSRSKSIKPPAANKTS